MRHEMTIFFRYFSFHFSLFFFVVVFNEKCSRSNWYRAVNHRQRWTRQTKTEREHKGVHDNGMSSNRNKKIKKKTSIMTRKRKMTNDKTSACRERDISQASRHRYSSLRSLCSIFLVGFSMMRSQDAPKTSGKRKRCTFNGQTPTTTAKTHCWESLETQRTTSTRRWRHQQTIENRNERTTPNKRILNNAIYYWNSRTRRRETSEFEKKRNVEEWHSQSRASEKCLPGDDPSNALAHVKWM